MALGATWMVLFKMVQRTIGMISTIILARLLIPADFGVVAMAMSIVAVLELLTAFSFDIALIRDSSAGRPQYDTAWTFNIIAAAACCAILLALAPIAAAFYSEPRLQAVIYALAGATLVRGFENIGIVAFRKELEFHKEFGFLLSKKLAAFAVTVPLAYILGNHWALIWGIFAGRAVGIGLSYYVHPYRPRFSLKASNELFHFSKWLMTHNILSACRDRSPDFIVGRIAGPHALGLFAISYEISNLLTTELVAPINRAVYPGYAKVAGLIAELRRYYLKVTSTVALFTMPASVGVLLTADLFVPILLGPKWLEAIPVIQTLALFSLLTSLQSNNGIIYIALGIPKVAARLMLLSLCLLVPLLIWLTMRNGELGAAQAFLIASLITVWVNYAVLFRKLGLRLAEFFSALWRPVIATAAMGGVVTLLRAAWPAGASVPEQAGSLAIVTVTGASAYILILGTLWWVVGRPQGPEQFLLDQIASRIPRLRAGEYQPPF